MFGSQIGNLIPNLSFGHNFCFKYLNASCKPILDIYVSRSFQWYEKIFNPMIFDPCNCSLKIQESIGGPSRLQLPSGSPLGSVWVHSLTLSYTLGNMKCDSQTSFLACTFASPCFGYKPKPRVVTISQPKMFV